MLRGGRIPLTPKESAGIERLLEAEGIDEDAYLAKSISLSRELPDEKGAILVEIEGETWRVDGKGQAKRA